MGFYVAELTSLELTPKGLISVAESLKELSGKISSKTYKRLVTECRRQYDDYLVQNQEEGDKSKIVKKQIELHTARMNLTTKPVDLNQLKETFSSLKTD